MKSFLLALVAIAVSSVEAASYARTASLSGQAFLDAFTWETIADPTHGRVNFVDQATAMSAGLCSVSGNAVTLRADDTTVLSPSGPGRDSFRLLSKEQYGVHVAIFDIGHMPEGCGTWPAVWCVSHFTWRRALTRSASDLGCTQGASVATFGLPWIDAGPQEVGANWPNQGEIDIVEGVNNKVPNQSTLHTSANCTMPSSRAMTGTSVGTDCDTYATNNEGCGVQMSGENSFGPGFNAVGGGWYAIERSASAVAIYFWERGSAWVPAQVQYPGDAVDTSTWGTPAALFSDSNCDFGTHLGPMNVVVDLTFCGDWAGAVYAQDGCPSTCVDYVNDAPGAFSGAYFEFNALNVYQ